MYKLRSLCICSLFCLALSKSIQRACTIPGASSMQAMGSEGLKHDILLQVNLEKGSQYDMISESHSGTLSTAVDFDGSLSAGENLSAPSSVLEEQRGRNISHTSVDPPLTEPDTEPNTTLKASRDSTEGSLSDSVPGHGKTLHLSRKQVTDAYMGALIVLGGISILVGNFLLERRDSTDNSDSHRVDSWSASFSGKPQNEIALEVKAFAETPRSRKEISQAMADSLTPDYTTTARILGEDVVRDEQLCDYVFVMPLKGASRANLHVSAGHFMRLDWEDKVNGLEKAKAVFMSPHKAQLLTEDELQERFSIDMTSEKYHDAMRKLLAETFTGRHFGLSIGADPSADHDEIFVKLSVPRHNSTIGQYAGNLSYPMPLTDATYERIGKKKKKDADENYTRAFTEFFPEHHDIYEPFREIDFVRLLKARLDKYINLTALCNQGVVAGHFSPHNYTEVRAMCETWANVWKWYKIPTHDNDDKVRNYFGEEVAWMFVWNVHYVRWLCLPAATGALMYFRIFLPHFLFNEIKIGFAVVMAVWSTLFNSFYDRCETRIRYRWGMHDYTPMASLFSRNDFRPHLRDSWRLIVISLLGDLLGLLTLGLTVGGMVAIDRFVDTSYYTHSLLITAQILLIDVWWRHVSLLIVQWENHEHQDKWLRSWTRKMFCVRIFNNLYPFLYVGFFKEHYTEKGCKPFDSCLDELSWDLLSYFAARILREVGANMMRLGILRLQIIHETWSGFSTPAVRFTHTYLELQAKALPYNDIVKMNDWIEQVLTFAFVACFSVVLPAISFVALLVSLLRTRMVAHRNALYLRRPLPRGSAGIDAWREMLVLTEVIAVVINLGFAIFVMKPLCDLSLDKKCVIFFVAEHLILAVKVTFKNKFPVMPSDVEKIERSCKNIVRRSFIDLRRHPVDVEVVQLIDDVPCVGPNAFGGRDSMMRRTSTKSSSVFTRTLEKAVEDMDDEHP